MTKLKEKIIKSVFWVGTAKGLGQLFSWLITIILARILSPTDFGLMAMALVFLHFAESFHELGLGVYIIHKKDIHENDINTCFWLNVLSGMLLMILAFIFSKNISKFFNSPDLENLIKILSINLLIISFTTVPLNLMSKTFEFRKRSIIEFFSDIISGIIAIILAERGYGVYSLVYKSIIRSGIFAVCIYSFTSFKPKLYFSITKLKNILSFGANVIGSKLLWYLYSNADYLIVGKFLGDYVLGIYRVAFIVSRKPLDKIWMILGEITLPAFSRVQENQISLNNVFTKFCAYVAIVIFPINIGLYFVIDDVVPLLLGEKWIEIIVPIKYLCILGIVKTLDIGIAPFYNAIGKPEVNLKFDFLSSIFIPLSILFSVQYGLNAVCLAWVVSYSAIAIYKIYFTVKKNNMRFKNFILSYFDPFIGTTVMALILFITNFMLLYKFAPVLKISINIFIGSLVYFSIMILFSMYFKQIFNEIFLTIKGNKT